MEYVQPPNKAIRHHPVLEVQDWGRLPYEEALAKQRALVEERVQDLAPDRLVLVEHPPVVTIGRSGGPGDLRFSEHVLRQQGVPYHYIDRGGKATFHGPGQLIAYPIIELQRKDLHWYVRTLLEAAASVLRVYGLEPTTRQGTPGIWVDDKKIASVGIAVRRWVTSHGIALNVNTRPEWFRWIVPCGNANERMTSMEQMLGFTVDMTEVKRYFIESFCHRFEYSKQLEHQKNALKHPPWLIRTAPSPVAIDCMEERLAQLRLATVCQSAHCPNLGECFERGTATFMILGTTCTRGCRFCAVEKDTPQEVDPDEPRRIAQAVATLSLTYAVVTSVTRDDLPDGGADQFVKTIVNIRERSKEVHIEVLIPDFKGSQAALQKVCDARPEMLNHNIETVSRLYPGVRPQADYRRSLAILEYAARQGLRVKSGLMLGLGETDGEVRKTLADLKRSGCRYVTIGQYLAPSKAHLPVVRYVAEKEFGHWADTARAMGFKKVAAGPLVRSSYRADALYAIGQL